MGGISKMTEKLGKTIQLLFVLAVVFGSHYLMPIRALIEPPLNYLGLLLVLAGVLLDVRAASLFRERETSFKLQGGAATMITDGPFGFSRNPIYLGIMTVLLGLAIFLGSLTAFIYPVLVFILFQFDLIPMEERRMEEAFGEDYLEYKRKVRRWL
jgi:protein-S-isoprenylcysteine O-methyltransferase Ste14